MKPQGKSQREFLREAMDELGTILKMGRAMTYEEMAARIGCPIKTYKKWMLETDNGREMPETIWYHVREVIEHERLKVKLKKPLAECPQWGHNQL